MSFIIGIDGGGTKTHAVITNLQGEKLYECFGGPSNFLIVGTEKVSVSLHEVIQDCLRCLNLSTADLAAVLLGSTGAGRRTDAELLETEFQSFLRSKKISIPNFRVESDARIALEGAFGGKPGSILIAGTGSIMFGKDKAGTIHRVGGFGRYLGDEGSGYSIGRNGLTAVAKAFDGRSEKTIISDLLFEKFTISTSESLIQNVYKNNFDIPSVAPLVLQAAELDDKTAIEIIEQETDELILHIKAMQKKINEPVLFISLIGGILSNKNIFSQLFTHKVSQQLSNCVIRAPEFPPEYGAIILAREFFNLK